MKRHMDKRKPTEYSVPCHLYFEQSCFTADTILTVFGLRIGKKKTPLEPNAVPILFTKQVTSKRNQRPIQKRKDSHFYTPSTNPEAMYISSGKLLKNVLMVSCYCGVYVTFMTIATMK